MAYLNYLNKVMIVLRPSNTQDTLSSVVEQPFTTIGSYPCRVDNLSGNEFTYLQRNADEDFQRIFTTNDAAVQELDIARITEQDETVIKEYEIRRIVRNEQTRRRHHIEIDAVSYDLLYTNAEPDYPVVATVLWLDDGSGGISNPWNDAEIWSE